jgi:tRNA G37 N-methylase TrmD
VPEVLLSGHHEEIRQWRRARSRERGAASGGSSLP